MSCIVATERGALWAEHIVAVGFNVEGRLTFSSRDGFTYPTSVTYTGPNGPIVAAMLLGIIEEQVRAAARASVVLVVTVAEDLRIVVSTRQRVVWTEVQRTTITVIVDAVAAMTGGRTGQLEADVDDTVPDFLETGQAIE